MRLAAPQGNFVMPDPAPASVLFLTAGSGITPVMSMLRTLARRGQIADVVHVHSAPTESDVMFAEELAAAGAIAHPGYRLQLRATRTEGRLDLARLDDAGAGLAGAADLGVRTRGDARRRRAGVGGRRDRRPAAPGAVRGVPRRGYTAAVARSTFARSGKTVAADAATSLMEAGEAAGVQMPFGCRMGICQSCVVGLVDGHVRDLRTGVEHEPGSRIQTCISAASGDCVLDV